MSEISMPTRNIKMLNAKSNSIQLDKRNPACIYPDAGVLLKIMIQSSIASFSRSNTGFVDFQNRERLDARCSWFDGDQNRPSHDCAN
jgi:hypothetical protein